MKFLIPLAVLLVAAAAIPTSNLLFPDWVNFKSTHGKTYANVVEELARFEIYRTNIIKIQAHNELYIAGQSTYQMALNQFADLTSDEFLAYVNKYNAQKPKTAGNRSVYRAPAGVAVAGAVDWRGSGLITEVKDQGSCGSCWAFSATGSLEAAYKNASGTLVSLSEQQLVDCATEDYGNLGCNGGSMDGAFDYIIDNGIVSESGYAYKGTDGKCSYNVDQVVTKVKTYVDIARSEEDLVSAVATIGPISVAIDASLSLQLYGSGILDDLLCESGDDTLNHGVLAVGYGTQNGDDFWVIKNSWGDNWGEKGYFRLVRKDNQCGISNMASYPIV